MNFVFILKLILKWSKLSSTDLVTVQPSRQSTRPPLHLCAGLTGLPGDQGLGLGHCSVSMCELCSTVNTVGFERFSSDATFALYVFSMFEIKWGEGVTCVNEYNLWITLKQFHTVAQFLEAPLKTVTQDPDILSNPGIFSSSQTILTVISQVAALNNSTVLPAPLLAVFTGESGPRAGSHQKTWY